MPERLRLALLFGGRSAEHEVSVESARSVLAALDRQRYAVLPVGILRDGRLAAPAWVEAALGPEPLAGLERLDAGAVAGGLQAVLAGATPAAPPLDVVFPLLHGPFGEDGTVQGACELLGLPYVGAGVAASAVGMDKVLSKRCFTAAGLPLVPWHVLESGRCLEGVEAAAAEAEEAVGIPCFVKPGALGSSIGVHAVRARHQLAAALLDAAAYGDRVIVETAVPAREIECAVLGNRELEATPPGEVVLGRPWYDYTAKYRDPETRLEIPAPVPAPLAARAREYAVAACRAIGVAGMARVDFLLHRETGDLYLNEVNTIPGFTARSMYPRLWAHEGLSLPRLLDRLVELALERHALSQRRQPLAAGERRDG